MMSTEALKRRNFRNLRKTQLWFKSVQGIVETTSVIKLPCKYYEIMSIGSVTSRGCCPTILKKHKIMSITCVNMI